MLSPLLTLSRWRVFQDRFGYHLLRGGDSAPMGWRGPPVCGEEYPPGERRAYYRWNFHGGTGRGSVFEIPFVGECEEFLKL